MASAISVTLVVVGLGLAGLTFFAPQASASSCTGLQSGDHCTGVCTGYLECTGVCNGDNYRCFGVCLDSYADCNAYLGENCSPNNDFTPKVCPFCCSGLSEAPETTRSALEG